MENRKSQMKTQLAESLRGLMVRSLFEKITIKQICDRTGVIRATFYNYFDDKYDCLNWIVYHDLIETNTSYLDRNEVEGHISEALCNIDENRAFYRAAYNVTGQNSFEEMIRANLKICLKMYFEQYRRHDFMARYDNDLLAGYYAETMAFCLRMFVFEKGGCTSVEDTRKMIRDLMNHSINDFLQQR